MTDDIKAIRDALAAGPTPGPWTWWTSCSFRRLSSDTTRKDGDVLHAAVHSDGVGDVVGTEATKDYIAAVHPERIARLLDALEQASKDADRYRYLRDRVPAEVLGQVKSAAGCWIDGEDDEGVLILLTGSDADAAIDDALKRGA